MIRLLVIIMFAAAAACTRTADSRHDFIIAESKSYEASIYRQNCAICHGNEANGKDLNGKIIPSLRFGEAAKKSRREIYDQIKYGKLPMPGFGNQLSEVEIDGMVRFVRRDLQGKTGE